MRLKNVKGAKEKIEACSYVILNPQKYKGEYKKLFNNSNPIQLEIGIGKGQFIIEMARCYPQINFIGIEKYDSVMVRAVDKLEDIELPNLYLIKADATKIEDFFVKEIDIIYLNFSDPWPKKRHADRRLTSFKFLNRYDNLFKKRGHIIIKTDNRHFFEYSIQSITNYGYTIENLSLDLYKDDISDNIPTEYEMKFFKKGLTIYKMEVIKDN